MTRIKKRRSGKNKTADQLRTAAGKRRARKAEKPATVTGAPGVINQVAAKTNPPQKKRYERPVAGRRGGRAAKAAVVSKESFTKETAPTKNAVAYNKKSAPAKASGKTRTAGARRIAVAKSVLVTGKKMIKKSSAPEKETTATDKPAKGFAPWNKNKFKKKSNSGPGTQPGKKYAAGKRQPNTAGKKPAGKKY